MNIFMLLEDENAEAVWQKFVDQNPNKDKHVLLDVFEAYFKEPRWSGNPFAQVYLDLAAKERQKLRDNTRGFMDMLTKAGVFA